MGFIIANDKMETSVKGIFVAGDCRVTPLRQITTAVGTGDRCRLCGKIPGTIIKEISGEQGNMYQKDIQKLE